MTIENVKARPFDFADLNGKPEPESWGPKYSKPVKRKAAFNDETNIPTHCASGQKRCFDAAKHRAKLKAEFAAQAGRDSREWALGKLKDSAGHTIAQAYELAMVAKRDRLRARACGLEAVRAALFGAVEFAEAA
jgi:hypothetical protein